MMSRPPRTQRIFLPAIILVPRQVTPWAEQPE
ncbi:hypothetical protein FOVG_17320 [Fusarium oxysporum f. sp. pisi HDV247]|uniref:Uncharacterized protein n=1 Tax=Fusarium oxysporum f. sp. pisi HDV247 TaxID=1080344 RepID=W9NF33_FUSOX|nr:hypothetical protein FOVG_17320 [Fusarium oxysporum f. sp. pisi HDV247]